MAGNVAHDPILHAFEVGAQVGATSVGSDELLCSLLAGNPDSEASELLASLGIDEARFVERIRDWWTRYKSNHDERADGSNDRVRDGSTTLTSNSSFSRTLGLAEGFAAWRHDGRPNSIDYLFAFVWGDPITMWLDEFEKVGITRERIIEELRSRGFEIPVGAPFPKRTDPTVLEVPREKVGALAEILTSRFLPTRRSSGD